MQVGVVQALHLLNETEGAYVLIRFIKGFWNVKISLHYLIGFKWSFQKGKIKNDYGSHSVWTRSNGI